MLALKTVIIKAMVIIENNINFAIMDTSPVLSFSINSLSLFNKELGINYQYSTLLNQLKSLGKNHSYHDSNSMNFAGRKFGLSPQLKSL